MYELAVQAKVSIRKREEFLQTLRSLQNDEEGGMGSAELRLLEEKFDQTTYRLLNKWETEVELEKCLSSEGFKILIGAIQVLCIESAVQYRHIPENLIHHLNPMIESTAAGSTAW